MYFFYYRENTAYGWVFVDEFSECCSSYLEQAPRPTYLSCNGTDLDLAAARCAGYMLNDDGRGGHGRSVTMGGAKSKIMGAAGAIAGLFHAASAHAQEFADPAGSGVLVSAVRWLEGTLLGTIATVLAVIAVATVGFMMLTGRIN